MDLVCQIRRMKLIKHDAFFNDPWTDLDRLFESTLPELYQWSPLRLGGRVRSLPLDVYEGENERVIRLEMPGVKKKDITIELDNAVLSVSAKRVEKSDAGETVVELSRSASVGEDINPDKRPKRWKDIWSAGHSVSGVDGVPTVADLVDRLVAEYEAA